MGACVIVTLGYLAFPQKGYWMPARFMSLCWVVVRMQDIPGRLTGWLGDQIGDQAEPSEVLTVQCMAHMSLSYSQTWRCR